MDHENTALFHLNGGLGHYNIKETKLGSVGMLNNYMMCTEVKRNTVKSEITQDTNGTEHSTLTVVLINPLIQAKLYNSTNNTAMQHTWPRNAQQLG